MDINVRTGLIRRIDIPNNQNVNITWRQEKFYPLYDGNVSSSQLKSKMSLSNNDSTGDPEQIDDISFIQYNFDSKETYFFSEQKYAQEVFGGVGDYRKNPIRIYGTIDLMITDKINGEISYAHVDFGPTILSSNYSTLISSTLRYSDVIIIDIKSTRFYFMYEPSLTNVEIKLEPANDTLKEATSYLKIKASGSCMVSSDMTTGLGSVYMYPKITITNVEQLK